MTYCPFSDEHLKLFFKKLNMTDFTSEEVRIAYSTSKINLSSNYFHGLSSINIISSKENIGLHGLQDVFKGAPQLKEVNSRGNNISDLNIDVFQYLDCLETLDLSYNSISNLRPGIFQNLKSLKNLAIDNNRLENLTSSLFRNLSNLEILNISNNKIRYLPPDVFQSLTSLQSLNLRGNNLKSVIEDMFNGLKKLKTLDLSQNSLELDSSVMNSPFRECDALVTLNLSENRIIRMYHDWVSLSKLKTLDLKSNDITVIPENTMSTLITGSGGLTIDLSNNQIEEVQNGWCDTLESKTNEKVTNKIILNANPISCNRFNYNLFHFINQAEKYRDVSIRRLKIIANNFACKTSNIKSVYPIELECKNVHDNCNLSCSCVIAYSTNENQATVDCSSAQILQMPQTLNVTYEGKVPSEIRLILRDNQIEKMSLQEPLPKEYTLVTELDLSNNKIEIEGVTDIIRRLPKLRTLDVSNNNFTSLSEDFKRIISSSTIKELHLSGNPWNCECNLYDFVHDTYICTILKDSKQIRCGEQNKLVTEMNTKCTTLFSKFVFLIMVVCMTFVTFGISVVLYCRSKSKKNTHLEEDRRKEFDAFVIYSDFDSKFVYGILIPRLKNDGYTVCEHNKDFEAGILITENIVRAVERSRHTIMVLTENFLKSKWCTVEFRSWQSVHDESHRLIILIYGDMPKKEKIPKVMEEYMNRYTYIPWKDNDQFWIKLKKALAQDDVNMTEGDYNLVSYSNI
ncbi:hypothetical protein WDU94_004615 [Cyamophila willieti]